MASKKWKKVRCVVEITTNNSWLTEKRLARLLEEALSDYEQAVSPFWFEYPEVSEPKVKQFSRVLAAERWSFRSKEDEQEEEPLEPEYGDFNTTTDQQRATEEKWRQMLKEGAGFTSASFTSAHHDEDERPRPKFNKAIVTRLQEAIADAELQLFANLIKQAHQQQQQQQGKGKKKGRGKKGP